MRSESKQDELLRRSDESRRRSGRRAPDQGCDDTDLGRPDKRQTFPQQLMTVLNNEEGNAEIIAWLPSGTAFVIRDKERLANEVLPRVLGTDIQYASFHRRLGRWRFVRITQGPEAGAFFNPLFQRDRPELCLEMQAIDSRQGQASEPLHPVAMGLLSSAQAAEAQAVALSSSRISPISASASTSGAPESAAAQQSSAAVIQQQAQQIAQLRQVQYQQMLLLQQQANVLQRILAHREQQRLPSDILGLGAPQNPSHSPQSTASLSAGDMLNLHSSLAFRPFEPAAAGVDAAPGASLEESSQDRLLPATRSLPSPSSDKVGLVKVAPSTRTAVTVAAAAMPLPAAQSHDGTSETDHSLAASSRDNQSFLTAYGAQHSL